MRKLYIVFISIITLFSISTSLANESDKIQKKLEARRIILTTISGGDFVHAGDKESIDFLISKLENLDHLKEGNTLDIGSGYGGTADYLMKKGFKKISGFDKDSNAVAYAKSKYPTIKFLPLDAKDISKKYKKDFFSFLYSFNALDGVEDKELILKSLATISEEGAVLAMFESIKLPHREYIDEKNVREKPPIFKDLDGLVLQPIELDKFSKLLKKTGWEITESIDISKENIHWYENFISNLKTHRVKLRRTYSEKNIEEVENLYQKLLFNLKQQKLGARLIIARKVYGNRKV